MEEFHDRNLKPYDLIVRQIKIYKRGSDTSPNKYILLLCLIDLFDNNPIHENKFYFKEIEPKFIECFNEYFPDYPDYRKMLEYPFYHLKNDGFWNLQLINGQEEKFKIYEQKRLTKKRLLETVEYAYLSEDAYQMFLNRSQRNLLKDSLISMVQGQYRTENQPEFVVQESSLFEHEQLAIEVVRNSITKMKIGQVLNNILVYDKQTKNYYECDLIVISYSGLYVVELKHWSGQIQIAPYNWLIRETQYRPDPHKSNAFKCKILKGIYEHHFRTYPNIWVESVVVLTNPDVEVEGADSPLIAANEAKHNLTFSSIGDFLTYIKKSNEFDKHILNDQQINNIASYLQSLIDTKSGNKYTIPGYETVEYLVQRPDRIEILARPTGPIARGLNRFRVFRIPDRLEGVERERFTRIAYNTVSAVSQLIEHPNILKVWVMQNDDGDIIEGSDWSETGTLRDYMAINKGELDIDEINSICHGICQGLIAAHQNNIIHRAVNPENILVSNNVPKLMNFDLAYQMDEDHLTVIADLESLIDDGYIAPEVLLGQDIDESTDFFSLGVIAYELITGSKPFKRVRQFIADGGKLTESDLAKLRQKQISTKTIEVIDALVQADRRNRLKDAHEILEAFSTDQKKPSLMILNAHLKPGDIYDVYEILDFIGEGREAQTYKARNERSEIVVLKLFNREIERERIFREGDNTAAVNSAYIVGCSNIIGYWKNDRYFLVLDYIDGESMRSWIEKQRKPDEETFRNVVMCLLQGIKAIHQHRDETGQNAPILHGDIKPDNILITNDGKAVLIDFGIAGPPRVDVFQGTLAYIPPDSIKGADRQFTEDSDLFALGISLWEWLCGQLPYEQLTVGEQPCINPDCFTKIPANMQKFLLKAIALNRENRFHNVEQMLAAFRDTKEVEVQEIEELKTKPDVSTSEAQTLEEIDITAGSNQNPFVSYLNTLSNTSAGNENATAESQIENKHFPIIRVEHPISKLIYQQLFTEKRNVILTGNAGDGKTTIAAEIYRRRFGTYKPLLSREESPDFVMIKDLSELAEDHRKEIFVEAIKNTQKSYLIVSNTGTLLENLSAIKHDGINIDKNQLLAALEANHPLLVGDGRFLIINIGRINSISTALSVGGKMLAAENWQKCTECVKAKDCPIHVNVNLLQENQDLILERIGLVYRRLYEYGNRLTMRQMTGHLAYIITAGLDCEDVRGMSKIAMEQQYTHYLFFNRFFGDDGQHEVPEARQLLPVRKIREIELGIFLDPFIERYIWRKQPDEMKFSERAAKILADIRGNREVPTKEVRIQVRRLLYFLLSPEEERASQYISGFLRSPMLLTYVRHVENNEPFTSSQKNWHLGLLLHVLQEYFAGVRLLEDEYRSQDLYITLKPPGFSTTQMILGKARAEDFSLGTKNIYDIGGITHRILILRYKDGQAELELDLPFLDYVARRYRGEVAEELSVFYMDRLQKFKVMLLKNLDNTPQDGHIELLSMAGSRKFETLSVKVADEHMEVIM
jgi:serine/threonine protein kinase